MDTIQYIKCLDCGSDIPFERRANNRVICLCPECRVQRRRAANRAYQRGRKRDLDALRPGATRRCHDCGKPSNDYRCAECWEKIRGPDHLLDKEDFGDTDYIVY